MNKAEFRDAFTIADDGNRKLGNDGLGVFDGFGLPDFKPVTVTLVDVARLMRWQALTLVGTWDHAALDEIRTLGRGRFVIAGKGKK